MIENRNTYPDVKTYEVFPNQIQTITTEIV